MPYLGTLADLPEGEVERLMKKLLETLSGEDSTVSANALAILAVAVCLRGGATKEQVSTFLQGVVDSFPFPRAN